MKLKNCTFPHKIHKQATQGSHNGHLNESNAMMTDHWNKMIRTKGGAERHLGERANLTRSPVPRRNFPSVYRRPAKQREYHNYDTSPNQSVQYTPTNRTLENLSVLDWCFISNLAWWPLHDSWYTFPALYRVQRVA